MVKRNGERGMKGMGGGGEGIEPESERPKLGRERETGMRAPTVKRGIVGNGVQALFICGSSGLQRASDFLSSRTGCALRPSDLFSRAERGGRRPAVTEPELVCFRGGEHLIPLPRHGAAARGAHLGL